MYCHNITCLCLVHVCLQHIFRESKQWESLLNLTPKQVAEELTKVVRQKKSLYTVYNIIGEQSDPS